MNRRGTQKKGLKFDLSSEQGKDIAFRSTESSYPAAERKTNSQGNPLPQLNKFQRADSLSRKKGGFNTFAARDVPKVVRNLKHRSTHKYDLQGIVADKNDQCRKCINNSRFFEGCSSAFKHLVSVYLEKRQYDANEITAFEDRGGVWDGAVVREHEPVDDLTDCLFVVENGYVEVLMMGDNDQQQVLGILGPYSVFGAAVMLGISSQHISTVRVQDSCNVWILPRRRFEEVSLRFPGDISLLRNRVMAQLQELVLPHREVLERNNFFRLCSPECVDAIINHLHVQIFLPGQVIIQEGDEGDCMILLIRGTLDIVVEGLRVGSTSEPGSYFGEIALLGVLKTRTATIMNADEVDSIVCLLHREDFEAILEFCPREHERFKDVAQTRFAETQFHRMGFYNIPAFQVCNENFLFLISLETEIRVLHEGEVLVEAGDIDDNLYIVHSGTASLYVPDDPNSCTDLEPHSCQGWSNVFGLQQERPHTIQAPYGVECVILVVPRHALLNAIQHFPQERYRFQTLAGVDSELEERILQKVANVSLKETLQNSLMKAKMGMDDDIIETLVGFCRPVIFYRDQDLLTEGTDDSFMLILLRGSVDIVVGGSLVGTARAPTWFGEMAMLGLSTKRTATVRARTFCEGWVLHCEDFDTALLEFPNERQYFETLAQDRLGVLAASQVSELHSLSMFKDCTEGFLDYIEKHLDSCAYLPGEIIIKEGETGSSMYILISGRAECTVAGQRVGELNEGTPFGEMVFFGEPVRTATVRTTTVCVCRVLHAEVLNHALFLFPKEGQRFAEMATNRRRVINMMVNYDRQQKQTEEELPSMVSSINNEPLLGAPRKSLVAQRILDIQQRDQRLKPTALYDEHFLSASARRAISKQHHHHVGKNRRAIGKLSSSLSEAVWVRPPEARRPRYETVGSDMVGPAPLLPPVLPGVYTAGRCAEAEHLAKFHKALGSRALAAYDGAPKETGFETSLSDPMSPRSPCNNQNHVTACELSASDGKLWKLSPTSTRNPHSARRKYLRCRPTYTSPVPKLPPVPRRKHGDVASHWCSARDMQTEQMRDVGRAIFRFSHALLRMHQKGFDLSTSSSPPPSAEDLALRRTSSAPSLLDRYASMDSEKGFRRSWSAKDLRITNGAPHFLDLASVEAAQTLEPWQDPPPFVHKHDASKWESDDRMESWAEDHLESWPTELPQLFGTASSLGEVDDLPGWASMSACRSGSNSASPRTRHVGENSPWRAREIDAQHQSVDRARNSLGQEPPLELGDTIIPMLAESQLISPKPSAMATSHGSWALKSSQKNLRKSLLQKHIESNDETGSPSLSEGIPSFKNLISFSGEDFLSNNAFVTSTSALRESQAEDIWEDKEEEDAEIITKSRPKYKKSKTEGHQGKVLARTTTFGKMISFPGEDFGRTPDKVGNNWSATPSGQGYLATTSSANFNLRVLQGEIPGEDPKDLEEDGKAEEDAEVRQTSSSPQGSANKSLPGNVQSEIGFEVDSSPSPSSGARIPKSALRRADSMGAKALKLRCADDANVKNIITCV